MATHLDAAAVPAGRVDVPHLHVPARRGRTPGEHLPPLRAPHHPQRRRGTARRPRRTRWWLAGKAAGPSPRALTSPPPRSPPEARRHPRAPPRPDRRRGNRRDRRRLGQGDRAAFAAPPRATRSSTCTGGPAGSSARPRGAPRRSTASRAATATRWPWNAPRPHRTRRCQRCTPSARYARTRWTGRNSPSGPNATPRGRAARPSRRASAARPALTMNAAGTPAPAAIRSILAGQRRRDAAGVFDKQ